MKRLAFLAAGGLLPLMLGMPARGADGGKVATETIKFQGSLVQLDMVKLPAGSIEMPVTDKKGRTLPDAPKIKVEIKPIWMSKTEVTWEVFDVFAYRLDLTEAQRMALEVKEKDIDIAARSRPSKPYGTPDRNLGHQGYAAISVQFNSAQKFCLWLSEQTGNKYRLPTEGEWEYACRGGGPPLTLEEAALDKMAWYAGNSPVENNGPCVPHPVGQKHPNAWGLHDMLGNVWEWTQISQTVGVVKGGCYLDAADKIQSGSRSIYRTDWQLSNPNEPKSNWWLSDGPHVGFRVVRED